MQLKESNPFTEPVNVIVAAFFVLSFGLVVTSMVLRSAGLDDPITDLSGIALNALINWLVG